MANLFLLSQKTFVMCYCFRAPIKLFFWRLSNDCQIARPALVSGPQTRRGRIINILLIRGIYILSVTLRRALRVSPKRAKKKKARHWITLWKSKLSPAADKKLIWLNSYNQVTSWIIFSRAFSKMTRLACQVRPQPTLQTSAIRDPSTSIHCPAKRGDKNGQMYQPDI